MGDTASEGWLARRLQRHVDRAAQRMHDRLAASPESFRRSPSTIGTTLMAMAVLAVEAAAIVGLTWATIAADGWFGYLMVALGWLVVLATLTSPGRVPRDVRLLSETDQPWTHRFVRDLAGAVGVPPPTVIGVNTDLNAYAATVGLRRRRVLVIGLPFWTLQTEDERLATLAHELGHFRGRDTARGWLISLARDVLVRSYTLIHPGHVTYVSTGDLIVYQIGIGGSPVGSMGFLGRLVDHIQAALAWPLGALVVLFDRLEANSRQHREYLADRRAALVAGSAAMASALRLDLRGIDTALASAVLRGEDPFDYLTGRRSDRGLRRASISRDEPHRADATHPPDDLRVSLLDAQVVPPAPSGEVRDAMVGADRELAALRPELTRQLTHDLRAAAW